MEIYTDPLPGSREAKRAMIRDFKLERGCYYCARLPVVGPALSGAWPAHVLQLHHRDPSTKDPMFHRLERWAPARILAELEKCDVLCANHHAMEHWGHGTRAVHV